MAISAPGDTREILAAFHSVSVAGSNPPFPPILQYILPSSIPFNPKVERDGRLTERIPIELAAYTPKPVGPPEAPPTY